MAAYHVVWYDGSARTTAELLRACEERRVWVLHAPGTPPPDGLRDVGGSLCHFEPAGDRGVVVRHAPPRAPPPAPGECAEPAFATERAALEWLCAWVVERVHCDEWEAFLEARAPSDLVREVAEEYGIYLAPPTAAVGGSETDWSSGDP